MLRRKLLEQKREIDSLRAEGHSSGEDPEMDDMQSAPKRTTLDMMGVVGRRGHEPKSWPPLPEPDPTEPKPAVERLDPALVGMSPGLKHLYSGKEDRRGRYQWQTTIPKDVGKPAEDAETAKWALIVRHIKVSTCAVEIVSPAHMFCSRSTMTPRRCFPCIRSSSSLLTSKNSSSVSL